jgi:hypothetical protein
MSDSGTLRSIAWRELFPWLIIFRSFSISLGLTAMLAAMLGALLMPLGWKASSAMFLSQNTLEEDPVMRQIAYKLGNINARSLEGQDLPGASGVLPGSDVHGQVGDWSMTFQHFAMPVRKWFKLHLTVPEFAYFILGGLWSLAVWAFCGGIIVRQAIVKLSVGERISARGTLTHTLSKFLAYFSAPLFPLLLVVLITIPIALVGLLMRLGDVGLFIAALVWILVLIGGAIMAITLIGLLFGWPLMWGAIASERHSDSFDAVSRAYSYVFQRPLHYLFYALVASLFGALCWLLAGALEDLVIYLSWWSASFGADDLRVAQMREAIAARENLEGFDQVIASLFALWEGLVRLVATAFRYSFFWTATAAIYLLLRYDADHTEIDEVFLEDDENPRSLPTLKTDEQGVPQSPVEDSPNVEDDPGEEASPPPTDFDEPEPPR